MADDELMTGAELQVVIDWLGLDQRALAAILGVDERTVRRWVTGSHRIPAGAAADVERIEEATAAAVGELVEALGDASDVTVAVYRTAEDMWAARPEFEPYPAGWWRMVVARAVHETPGVAIVYATEGLATKVTQSPERTKAARARAMPSRDE